MTVLMEATTPLSSHDGSARTLFTGRLSVNHLRRGMPIRVVLSLIAVWLAASWFKPTIGNGQVLSPILGHDIPTDKKYGLSKEKLAIVFDPSHHPHSAFHLLHTISTLPADWPLLYVGTPKSIATLNISYPIQVAQEKGRLTMQPAPDWVQFSGKDSLQRLFVRPEFYNSLPAGVEHLFLSGTDSIMCSAALVTMDDLLSYDWLGSAWTGNSWSGGLNGYSLRRVSKVRQALRSQSRAKPIVDDPDLMEAVLMHPKSKFPSTALAQTFVMEDDWAERPMAYHPRKSLLNQPGWAQDGYRAGVWSHCPELKVIMEMKLDRERCSKEQLEEMAKQAASPNGDKTLAGAETAHVPVAAEEEDIEEEEEEDQTIAEAAAALASDAAKAQAEAEAAAASATESAAGAEETADKIEAKSPPSSYEYGN